VTDRYAMRLCRWTGSFDTTPWCDVADETPAEAMAHLQLHNDTRAFAAEIRDSLTGDVVRIPKVARARVNWELAAERLAQALQRAEAEISLNPFDPRKFNIGILRLGLSCAESQLPGSKQLFGDVDFAAWGVEQAVHIAAGLGHDPYAPPRTPRKNA
jgi:hypothetical protein